MYYHTIVCQRSVHEPAEEAPASFVPLFQLAPGCDSEPAGGTDYCTCLKNGICAGDTTYTPDSSVHSMDDAGLLASDFFLPEGARSVYTLSLAKSVYF